MRCFKSTLILSLAIALLSSCIGPALSGQSTLPMRGSIEYPNDGRIYNQFVGETIQGTVLADGWRSDSINYGYNKEVYQNPYNLRNDFNKRELGRDDFVYFYFREGIPIEGHHILEQQHWAGGKYLFEANFKDGKADGRAYFRSALDSSITAECSLENGEIVGEWISYVTYPNITLRKVYMKGIAEPQEYIQFDVDQNIDHTIEYKGKTRFRERQYEHGFLSSEKVLLDGKSLLGLPGYYELYNYSEFYPNGNPKDQGMAVSGQGINHLKLGTWIQFDEEGEQSSTEEHISLDEFIKSRTKK